MFILFTYTSHTELVHFFFFTITSLTNFITQKLKILINFTSQYSCIQYTKLYTIYECSFDCFDECRLLIGSTPKNTNIQSFSVQIGINFKKLTQHHSIYLCTS